MFRYRNSDDVRNELLIHLSKFSLNRFELHQKTFLFLLSEQPYGCLKTFETRLQITFWLPR